MIFAVALKTSTIIKHVVIHILLRNESLGQPTGSITGIQEYRYYRGTPKNIFSTAQTWHRAVLHLRRSGTPLTKKRYSTYEEECGWCHKNPRRLWINHEAAGAGIFFRIAVEDLG